MDFKYIDIHSHLNFSQFDEDREAVIAEMAEKGIATITVGTDYAASAEAIILAEKYEHLFACVGVHPTDVLEQAFEYEKFLALANHPKVLAVGECGFDYFRDQSPALKTKQREIFEAHIKLAIEVGKPLMIHARPSQGSMDAYHDTLEVLEQHQNEYPNLRANFHFFAGDVAVLERALAGGHTVSFDGPITFATDYDEVIKACPLESLMAETDAPFAAPAPYRGKRNNPLYVPFIYERIAAIKGIDAEICRQVLNDNARRFFGFAE